MTSSRPRRGLPGPLGLLAFLTLVALALAACSGEGPKSVAECSLDEHCGAGAFCQAGACRESAAPVATFDATAPLVSSKAMFFQASVTDADPGDFAAGHAWAVARVDATCDAEPEPTSGGTLEVVFWCAGRYDVTLVATDSHGVASAPVTRRFDVSQSPNLPTVTADSTTPSVAHRCSGEPLACSLVAPIALKSSGSDPGGQPLTYAWRARPDNARVVDASVTFSPSAAVPAPSASILTPGAISGDWRFALRVKNPDGFLARAEAVVHVENRLPVVSTARLGIDHTYEAGTYLASGALEASAADLDGDPVALSIDYVEPAASGCAATFDAVSATVSIACTEPGALIGAVARAATVTATDVNGDSAQAQVPVEIRNRPPVVQLAADPTGTALRLEHGVGACLDGAGQCFRVGGLQPFAAVDPDGDPVADVALATEVAPLASSSRCQAAVGAIRSFICATPTTRPLEFRHVDDTSPFFLSGHAVDPFGATGMTRVAIRVGNRPPEPKALLATAFAPHRYDAVAGEYLSDVELNTFDDPDGDPLVLSGAPGAADCADFVPKAGGLLTVTCRKPYALATGGTPPLASFVGTRPVTALADDPWVQVTAATSVTIGNRSPTLVSSNGPYVEACACVCQIDNGVRLSAPRPALLPSRALAFLPPDGAAPVDPIDPPPKPRCFSALDELSGVAVVDPKSGDEDGDPLVIAYAEVGGTNSWTRTVLPPDARHAFTGVYGPTTWSVTADDGGGGTASASVILSSVTCPTLGKTCKP